MVQTGGPCFQNNSAPLVVPPPSAATWATTLQGSADGTDYNFTVSVSKGSRPPVTAWSLVTSVALNIPTVTISASSNTTTGGSVNPARKLTLVGNVPVRLSGAAQSTPRLPGARSSPPYAGVTSAAR